MTFGVRSLFSVGSVTAAMPLSVCGHGGWQIITLTMVTISFSRQTSYPSNRTGRCRRARFCADLDTGPIFDRAIVIEATGGRRFPCFAPEDTLLTAATHGGKEQWSRLVWVADIAALLHAHPALDWTAVLERAREAGCLRMILLAAELARSLLGARLPDHVRGAIAQDRRVPRLVDHVWKGLLARTEAPSVYTLTRFRWDLRERVGDRWRYASRTLFAARVAHFRNVDLPDRLSFLYPVVRLAHDFLVMPAWRAMGRRASSQNL